MRAQSTRRAEARAALWKVTDVNRPTQARRSYHGPALWTGERNGEEEQEGNREEGQEERSGEGDVWIRYSLDMEKESFIQSISSDCFILARYGILYWNPLLNGELIS